MSPVDSRPPLDDPTGDRPSRSPGSALPMLPGLVCWAGAVVAAGFASGWNLVDDALILCRYAANAAGGAGWVFNPGERVESHSSPLWVALLAAGGRLGLDLPWLSRALGVAAGGALAALAAVAFRRLFDRPLAVVLTLLVAADAGLAVWSVSGMETSGFALLLFAAALVMLSATAGAAPGTAWLLGGLAGALALARPEGIPVGAILVGIYLKAPPAAQSDPDVDATRPGTVADAAPPAGDRPVGRGKAAPGAGRWPALLVWLAVVAGLTAWRISFYGDWLPSPVRAKLILRGDALLHGAGQVALFVGRRLPLFLAASLLVPAAVRAMLPSGRRGSPARPGTGPPSPSTRRLGWWSFGLLLIVMVLLGQVLLAGGDWMGVDRLPGPAVPLLALLAGFGLTAAWKARPVPPALLVIGAALCLALGWGRPDRIPPHGHAARQLGEWLRKTLPPETRLGVAAAGAVPYYSGLPAVDVLGITDPVVARTPPPPGAAWKPGHMRYDLQRFLNARPPVVVWEYGAAWTLTRMRDTPPLDATRRRGDYRRELLWNPEFRSGYRPLPGVPPEADLYFTVFRRLSEGGAR